MTKLTTSDFWIGDEVVHIRGSPVGIVVAHNHAGGLIRVKWKSEVYEWVTPEEIRLTVDRD